MPRKQGGESLNWPVTHAFYRPLSRPVIGVSYAALAVIATTHTYEPTTNVMVRRRLDALRIE